MPNDRENTRAPERYAGTSKEERLAELQKQIDALCEEREKIKSAVE